MRLLTSVSSAFRGICALIITIRRVGVSSVIAAVKPLDLPREQPGSRGLKIRIWRRNAKNVDHGLFTFTTRKTHLSQVKILILGACSAMLCSEEPSNLPQEFKN